MWEKLYFKINPNVIAAPFPTGYIQWHLGFEMHYLHYLQPTSIRSSYMAASNYDKFGTLQMFIFLYTWIH